jgi:hypothetical protein
MKGGTVKNPFLGLVQRVVPENMCVSFPCTTCGAGQFRSELRSLNKEDDEGLTKALRQASIEELMALPKWGECLRWALHEIQRTSVGPLLEVWLGQTNLPVQFIDYVLYYVVRHLPDTVSAKRTWIDRCIGVAVATGDESLTESIVFVLGHDVVNHPIFLSRATEMANHSRVVATALRKMGEKRG